MNRKETVLALSGGVDSAVAGYLLKQAGYDVRAVFMVNWKERGSCNWEDDLISARRVAKHLNISLEIWDFAKAYKDFVFNDFIGLYKKGQTPNPDVFCNKYIKFGAFYDRARKEGADFVATGHYARIMDHARPASLGEAGGTRNKEQDPPFVPPLLRWGYRGVGLFSAVDKTKDQSDFLYQIKQSQLAHIMFPMGGMLKSEVKDLAKNVELPNWDRPESMGVCFIGEMNMKKFLQNYIQPKSGDIVDTHGTKLGVHDGVWYYTLGQREGLNIGGTGPYFVVKKELRKNRLVVAKEPEAGTLLMVKKVELGRVNIFTTTFPCASSSFPRRRESKQKNKQQKDLNSFGYSFKFLDPKSKFGMTEGVEILWRDRHLSSLQKGVLKKERGRYTVEFEKPKRAVTPGQSLVMYDLKGERVIGGGVIAKAISK